MTPLDAYRRCELTSFNSHKDLMGWIVTPSRRAGAERGGAGCSGDGEGRNCFSWRCFSPWKG